MSARARDTLFLAVGPSLRLRIETTVENLLALLDQIDGDPDLEDDREDDDEREPDQDDEYSAGWANQGSQEALHTSDELEDDEREEDFVEDWRGLIWKPQGGVEIAAALLSGAKPRRRANRTYAEISHKLPDGAIMRTVVAADDSKIWR